MVIIWFPIAGQNILAKKTRNEKICSAEGMASPTYSLSARCRTFGASSQKFAEKTKFHKVLVKSAPPGCLNR
jgi:hypothetical protein